jgi:CheY-like chemotaxis protein
VADDNDDLRGSVCEVLRTEGYEVSEADDGDTASASSRERPTSVVVLDVRMPRLDGIAMIEHMQPAPPPPAIVLVSAYELGPEDRAHLGTRVVRFLRKPVSPAVLLAVVSEAAAGAGAPV